MHQYIPIDTFIISYIILCIVQRHEVKKMKTGKQLFDADGFGIGYTCPECGKTMSANEGSSEAREDGSTIVCCEFCGKESISDEGAD